MTLLDVIKESFTADWRKVDLRRTVLLVLLILAVAAALWQYLMPQIRTIESTTFKRVPEIKKVVDVQRVYIKCPERGIVVLDKAELTKNMNLSWLQGGDLQAAAVTESPASAGEVIPPQPGGPRQPDLQVTGTADIPATSNGVEAMSVIDMETGVTTITVREKPAPWFQFRNDGAVGIRYGLDQRLQYIGNFYGKWDFLRVKDVYFSAVADLETGGDAKLQAGAEYRW